MEGKDPAIEQWRICAIEDGWHVKDTEKLDGEVRMYKLTKGKWVALIYNEPDKLNPRCVNGIERGYREISVWGEDELAVDVPDIYSFKELEHNTHKCMYCGGFFDDTVRIGFAGRCCQPCRAKHVAEVETPGWCD